MTVVLRKSVKPDYTVPGAHRLIALINMMAKLISACMAEDLVHLSEIHKTLLDNHFGCRPGRTMTDSLHYISKLVKDAWRKGEVVSTLFLDIKSAFPSVVLDWLVHNMRQRGVPAEYTNWIRQKVSGRKTTLKFNRYESEPITLPKGLDQGCPLSSIVFQFYNADLVDIWDPSNGKEVITFMDDMLMLAQESL